MSMGGYLRAPLATRGSPAARDRPQGAMLASTANAAKGGRWALRKLQGTQVS